MTPRRRSILTALLARVAERGGRPDSPFLSNEICQWPKSAVEALMKARLLRDLPIADTITCRGCEEHCRRPVEVSTREDHHQQRVTWTCHLHSGFGPFDEPLEVLRRWSCSREMVAKFLGRALKLEVRDHDANWRRISFATLRINGASRAFRIEFDVNALVKVGSTAVDLVELLEWDDSISIDLAALTACFNASDDAQSGGKRVQPSNTVREDAKLSTKLLERKLQQRMDELARKNPHLNKEQLAKKLVKSGMAEGMGASRVTRVTRKPKKSGRKNFA